MQIEISAIPDPDDFLKNIVDSYRVHSFFATFTGPNPFDADEFFQKPFSKYLQMINGEHGSADVRGKSLDKEAIQAVAKSTAATGNQARARIVRSPGDKSITINLNGDPVKKKFEIETPLLNISKTLNEIYYEIRNSKQ